MSPGPRISICERRSCLGAGATHVPCSAWTTQSVVQASRRSAGGTRRKRRRRASGRRSSAGRAAGAGRPGRVRTSDGVRLGAWPTSSERVEGVRADPQAADRERSSHRQGALAGGVDGARRANAASSLLPVHSHALPLLIASSRGVARTRPSCARVHCRGMISGCWRQRGEGTRSLRVQRAPIPSSTSCRTLVLPSASYNYHSGGVPPARVAHNAIVDESEGGRSIGARARTRLARARGLVWRVRCGVASVVCGVDDASLPRRGSEGKTGIDSEGYRGYRGP